MFTYLHTYPAVRLVRLVSGRMWVRCHHHSLPLQRSFFFEGCGTVSGHRLVYLLISLCVFTSHCSLSFTKCSVYGFDFLLLRLSFLFRGCSLSVDTAWCTFLYYRLVLRSYIPSYITCVCNNWFCPLQFYKNAAYAFVCCDVRGIFLSANLFSLMGY